MNFGMAIEALKDGFSIARAGWNGKGMFVYLNRGSYDAEPLSGLPGQPAEMDGISTALFDIGDVGTSTRLPNINMRTASGATVTGWLASQTDMLAEDWQTLPVGDAALPKISSQPVPPDVAQLVITGRRVAYDDPDDEDRQAFDQALEAFSSRVPYDDEPELHGD